MKKVDGSGWTALMSAAYFGCLPGVKLLLEHSDAAMVDGEGCTAADLAREKGHVEIAGLISAYALSRSELNELENGGLSSVGGWFAAERQRL